ncbi:MAG: HAD hydrolase-like protein, partial [Dehalococcoidia bacterium]
MVNFATMTSDRYPPAPDAHHPRPRFEAAIFDLDGLLIDSEPLWRIAEMEVFATVGVTLAEEECHLTTGLRTDQVVAFWLERR